MAIKYEPVIGLEVHAQLLSRTKLYCACSSEYGAAPNTRVCPVCLGLPGALPVPNRDAIDKAVRTGLALGCSVQKTSRFARKNYFYPDMAKGYQISQYEYPLNGGGALEIQVGEVSRKIGITRIHIEEDAAKNLHGSQNALVDFNRAGVALMEIVSEPDLRSPAEAEAYLKKLREILMTLGVNDGNMEEGSFRCDANVSIRPLGEKELGIRVELKNINSFRFVRKALEYEIARQEALLSGDGAILRETRLWNENEGKTLPMRGKEEAHDYRYFPDPDLPPLVLSEARIGELKSELPELPDAKRLRWQNEWGLRAKDADVLTGHPAVATYFEDTATLLSDRWGDGHKHEAAKQAANFIQAEVLRHLKTSGLEATFPVTSGRLAELLDLVRDGTINGKIAKEVFTEMAETGRSARSIVEARGLAQLTDIGSIETEVRRVLETHPEQLEKYRSGKTNLFGFFVGQVMKATRGTANPDLVNRAIKAALGDMH